jgi:hypothetical protein
MADNSRNSFCWNYREDGLSKGIYIVSLNLIENGKEGVTEKVKVVLR